MADKTIGSLPQATELDEESLLVTEQLGEARSVTGALLADYAKAAAQQEAQKAGEYAQSAEESANCANEAAKYAWEAAQGFSGVIDPITGQLDTVQTALDNLYNLLVSAALSPITAQNYDSLGLAASDYDAQNITASSYDTTADSILGG